MKTIKVGITGVNPFDGNRGVGALSYSIVSILDSLSKDTGVRIIIYFIINSSQPDRECELDINGKIYKVKLLRIVSIFTLNHFLKLLVFFKDFLQYLKLDCVLDAGYGDSYSDIYGRQVFWAHNSTKRFFSLLRKKQMLLPQTIGPFFDKKVHNAAVKAMNNIQVILARDRMSYNFVVDNVANSHTREVIDMAFFMPYHPEILPSKGVINVGIGVSKLLWDKNLEGTMKYKGDYVELMKSVINEFLRQKNVIIHLVPHVVCENSSKGNDYELCYEIYREYHNPRLILSPFFITPIKAKNYISSLDFFAGARMHACIAAFSSGVPVYPIAYSRKFIGLFNETLDYKYVGDLSSMDNSQILEDLIEAFEKREELKGIINYKNNTIVQEKYKLLNNELKAFLLPDE